MFFIVFIKKNCVKIGKNGSFETLVIKNFDLIKKSKNLKKKIEAEKVSCVSFNK